MALPVEIKAGIENWPIGNEEGVSARVFRSRFLWRRGDNIAMWQYLLPVAVVDRRRGRAKWQPVIDLSLAVPAAALLSLLILGRRSRRTDNG